MSGIRCDSYARKLYLGAVIALFVGVLLFAWLPPKHVFPTICFYTAVVLAVLCNFRMAKIGIVGRRSPYFLMPHSVITM